MELDAEPSPAACRDTGTMIEWKTIYEDTVIQNHLFQHLPTGGDPAVDRLQTRRPDRAAGHIKTTSTDFMVLPVRNLDRVHRRKREIVRDCVGVAVRNREIRRVIIFGSSVTDRCDENSDLDICLDITENAGKKSLYESVADMSILCGGACDILIYSRLREPLRSAVDGKGVVVYVSDIL